ncbi:hypothetical protein VKT23_008052 [Stygiomarasmius scandens]|uniref:Uncharacterized protein n=1 Tax=Marasmiellus scandens TaxID=2682957 RepID=A0ABR1JJ50_9AGAR
MSVNDISLLYPSSKFSPFKLQFFTVLIVSLPSLAAPVVKAEDLEISSSPSRDRRQALVSRDNEDLVDARSNFIVDPSSQGCKSSASSSSDGEGSASASASSSSQDQDCNADASANSSNGANEEDSPAPVDNESSSSNS